MGLFFTLLALSFIVILLVNIVWAALSLYLWVTEGLQAVLLRENFTERLYASVYLKWILLTDGIWWAAFGSFLLTRRHYKTNPDINYLNYTPIIHLRICVVIFAYNEELIIEKVVKDFINQKNVEHVIVIDNHSSDRTAEIAEHCGAKVIRKDVNKGYAHSWLMGLVESLKTDANVIALTDSDGTYSGYDLAKMIPYLDNCDMVIGNRMVQGLSEKGNQMSAFLVWGNVFIAKLLQIKYFSLRHLGIIHVSDAGCSYRCFRREAVEKIVDHFVNPGTEELVFGANYITIGMFTTSTAIENNLKVIEVPITFKKRIGVSKTRADKKSKAIKYGLHMIWYIIRS